jgi:hypothetical protein
MTRAIRARAGPRSPQTKSAASGGKATLQSISTEQRRRCVSGNVKSVARHSASVKQRSGDGREQG